MLAPSFLQLTSTKTPDIPEIGCPVFVSYENSNSAADKLSYFPHYLDKSSVDASNPPSNV